MLRRWEKLPEFMKCEEVRVYYDILNRRRVSLCLKKVFDVTMSLVLLIVLIIPMILIAIMIKLDSNGPVFYRQERVTVYGRKFRIHKFRTMVDHADQIGSTVTVGNDGRITRLGARLRRYRLDELPQLIDILEGNMSFVGTRPEVLKYVKKYTKEMRATLLLPAGITSEASIRFKDEAELLSDVEDIDRTYMEKVLPLKMVYNLKSIREFGFCRDMRTMILTVFAMLR